MTDDPFLKCPKCNEGYAGRDHDGEAIDCHYCGGNFRITAELHCDLVDRFECAVGDAMCGVELLKVAEKESERLRELVRRAVVGLKHVGAFTPIAGCDPHPLDCTLAGRVSHVFCTGMARAIELCREFGEDPSFRDKQEKADD